MAAAVGGKPSHLPHGSHLPLKETPSTGRGPTSQEPVSALLHRVLAARGAFGAGGDRRALAQDKIAITDQERGDMLALATRMKTDNLVPYALGFCPQARS